MSDATASTPISKFTVRGGTSRLAISRSFPLAADAVAHATLLLRGGVAHVVVATAAGHCYGPGEFARLCRDEAEAAVPARRMARHGGILR